MERFGRNRNPELGNVALKKRLREVPPPRGGHAFAPREMRARETAPKPEAAPRGRRGLRKTETGNVDKTHATGQRFRNATRERRRDAAQNEKLRRVLGPVDEHAQRFEELRHTLHFVDDHEAGQTAQRQFGHLQSPPVDRVFKIEERAQGSVGRQGSRQSALAALSRASQSRDRMNGESLLKPSSDHWTFDEHAQGYSLKFRKETMDFQETPC